MYPTSRYMSLPREVQRQTRECLTTTNGLWWNPYRKGYMGAQATTLGCLMVVRMAAVAS
jgi:hypothetical protein